MCVLVIDSNPQTHDALQRCMSKTLRGKEVMEFADPFFGLQYGVSHPVELLVIRSTAGIPALAFNISRTLRQRHPGLPIVLLADALQQKQEGERRFPDAAVVFPASAEGVQQAVDRLMQPPKGCKLPKRNGLDGNKRAPRSPLFQRFRQRMALHFKRHPG